MIQQEFPPHIKKLVEDWSRTQLTLPRVIRWGKYVQSGSRRQDTLQHSYSITLFALWLFPRLRTHVRFDEDFVLKAVILHDIGEGEIGADTLYIDKNNDGDIAECNVFLARFGNAFGPEGREAFLLQFASKARCMEGYERELHGINERRYVESLVFEAIERFDYLLYAIEQYYGGHVKILVQVLRHQIPHFSRLCRQLPGFREELWTFGLESLARDILHSHEGEWEEKEGDS